MEATVNSTMPYQKSWFSENVFMGTVAFVFTLITYPLFILGMAFVGASQKSKMLMIALVAVICASYLGVAVYYRDMPTMKAYWFGSLFFEFTLTAFIFSIGQFCAGAFAKTAWDNYKDRQVSTVNYIAAALVFIGTNTMAMNSINKADINLAVMQYSTYSYSNVRDEINILQEKYPDIDFDSLRKITRENSSLASSWTINRNELKDVK